MYHSRNFTAYSIFRDFCHEKILKHFNLRNSMIISMFQEYSGSVTGEGYDLWSLLIMETN